MVNLFFKFGGAEGARTPGLMTASHALSQLSYSPVSDALTNKMAYTCQCIIEYFLAPTFSLF